MKFTLPCQFRLRNRKRRPFISERGVRQNGVFQQFLYFKIRYDLGFQSRDK